MIRRRDFLAGAGAAAALGMTRPAQGATRTAAAAGRGDTLVFVFLRGGMDTLSAVVPYGDPDYYRLRPVIAVPKTRVLPLDGYFGLHPALAPLRPYWRDRMLAVVVAAGNLDPTRSHFDAQRTLEQAGQGPTGWLARHLAGRGGHSPFRAVAIGHRTPTSLLGNVPVTTLRRVEDLRYDGDERVLADLYGRLGVPLGVEGERTVGAARAARTIPVTTAGRSYPDSEFGRGLREIGRLVKAGVGVEVACLDAAGWDTHDNIGRAADGLLATLLSDLARGLAAFAADLGPRMRSTCVVVVSEFGRRATENGAAGAEHGHGGSVLLLGGGIRGGRIYGAWPTLRHAALDRGDLAVRTDVRDVLAEVAVRRLGGTNLTNVFPRHRPRFLGLTHPI